ncbi:hypothetical protein L901_26350 [Agrobacterium sp. D14]|nr:hypothetical protein L901_26350 [Agrobacterium sp. D14]
MHSMPLFLNLGFVTNIIDNTPICISTAIRR